MREKHYIYHIIEEWIVTGSIKYTGLRSDPETLNKPQNWHVFGFLMLKS